MKLALRTELDPGLRRDDEMAVRSTHRMKLALRMGLDPGLRRDDEMAVRSRHRMKLALRTVGRTRLRVRRLRCEYVRF